MLRRKIKKLRKSVGTTKDRSIKDRIQDQIKKIEVNSRFNSLCNMTKRIRQKCKIVSKAMSVEL